MKRAVLIALALGASSPAHAAGTSFFDDFNRFSTSRWYVSDGWTNGAHQNCSWSNKEVKIADGFLELGFTKAPGTQDRAYRCGEIQSNEFFSYGVYEARFKTPAGSGLNAAFFTYTGQPHGDIHDEIDFEVLLKDPSKVQAAGFVNGKVVEVAMLPLPIEDNAGYVDYALVWEPGRLRYYIDGKLGHTIESPAPVHNQPQKIFFSLWGTETLTDWMGPFVEPPGPLTMSVDWVAYSAPGESCLFPQSITCNPLD